MIIGKTRTNQPVEGDAKNMADALKGQDLELGDLTADSIIEKMSGYSFIAFQTDMTWAPVYVGAVKNGNKLTITIFGHFTYASGFDDSSRIAYITLPTEIMPKLVPYSLSGIDNVLDVKSVDLVSQIYAVDNKITIQCGKGENYLDIIMHGVNDASLVIGTKYLFRYEVTLLLSDNLVPEE